MFKDPEVRKEFSIALKNRFCILQDEASTTTAASFKGFNNAMTRVAEEVLL